MGESSITVSEILSECIKILEPIFGKDAITESEEIIAYFTGNSRISIHINHANIKVNQSVKDSIIYACTRRVGREPLGYISGKVFFMHNYFKVSPGVLIPRNDTERLVEQAKLIACNAYLESTGSRKKVRFLEFCTGSGCISISLIQLLDEAKVISSGIATDISDDAVILAQINAKDLGVDSKLKVIKHDLLSEDFSADIFGKGRFDLIISNPPYIRSAEIDGLATEVSGFEPRLALDGGNDGLKFYRTIAKSSSALLVGGGCVLVEIGYDQADAVREIFETDGNYTNIKIFNDYSGHPRVVTAVTK